MPSSVFECKICHEDFDASNRKPLFLTCGHTCCQACLTSGTRPTKYCPKCSKKFEVSVDELPINYDFIPPGNNGSEEGRCKDHGCHMDHFCMDCKEHACRKCVKESHRQHRSEFMDDILSKEPDVQYFTNQLEDKLKNKLEQTTKSASLPQKLSSLMKENRAYLMDVQTWVIAMLTERTLAITDLESWNDSGVKSKAEKRKLFKNLCRHWTENVELHPDKIKMLNFVTKLNVLNRNIELIKDFVHESIALELSPAPPQLLRDYSTGKWWKPLVWEVDSSDAARNAVASVDAGRRTDSALVVSRGDDRLWNVPELLMKIGSACPNTMEVMLMDHYWEFPTRTNDSLQPFIEEHGHKVTKFFGSTEDACAIARAVTPWLGLNGLLFSLNRIMRDKRLELGLRLTKMSDIDRCSALHIKPKSISCIRGLPAVAGDRIRKLEWKPKSCHFPDLQDGDTNWVQTLLESVSRPEHIVLPRCSLTESGFGDLLEMLDSWSSVSDKPKVYCHNSALTEAAVERLRDLALQKEICLNMTIPDDVV